MEGGLTLPEKAENYVSYSECEAMFYLSQMGKDMTEIAFMLERKQPTVSRHVNKKCDHP